MGCLSDDVTGHFLHSFLHTSSRAAKDRSVRHHAEDYTALSGLGRFLTATPSMMSDQPLKIMSMPTKAPITQRPSEGHCRQIMIPNARLMTPCKRSQIQLWNRTISATATRNRPPKIRNSAIKSVRVTADAAGFAIIMKP